MASKEKFEIGEKVEIYIPTKPVSSKDLSWEWVEATIMSEYDRDNWTYVVRLASGGFDTDREVLEADIRYPVHESKYDRIPELALYESLVDGTF